MDKEALFMQMELYIGKFSDISEAEGSYYKSEGSLYVGS